MKAATRPCLSACSSSGFLPDLLVLRQDDPVLLGHDVEPRHVVDVLLGEHVAIADQRVSLTESLQCTIDDVGGHVVTE
jgi:hypothetical protein